MDRNEEKKRLVINKDVIERLSQDEINAVVGAGFDSGVQADSGGPLGSPPGGAPGGPRSIGFRTGR